MGREKSMINRLAKALGLSDNRRCRSRKNDEHRLGVETLEPRMLLAATVVSQAIASPGVAVEEPAPAAALVVASADFDADGDVDGTDLAQWEGDYGQNGDSDANGDGASTGLDFLAWQRQYTGSLAALFSDDFNGNTTGNYTVTLTEGNDGSHAVAFLYDAAGERVQVDSEDNGKVLFSQAVTATDSGTFSIDFNPTEKYPYGGKLWVRLLQDANNYYEIRNTDGYGAGEIRKFVGGVEAESASFTAEYSQNNNYTISIDFSPTQTTVDAFGDQLTLNTNTASIAVDSFEVEASQQTAYFDNILLRGARTGDTQAPTVPTNLNATAVSSSQIDLSWTASTDDTTVPGYSIYRDGVLVTTTVNTTYQDAGLAPSTNYSYTVAAFDAAGNLSAQSAEANAITATGNVFYVGPGETYTTIQAAANAVGSTIVGGDTVIVRDGIYTVTPGANKLVQFSTGGDSTNGFVTFRSETPWGAIIDATGGLQYLGHAFVINSTVEYLRIEGFEIKNAENAGIKIHSGGADHIEIIGNNIHHNKGAAGISAHGLGDLRTKNLLIDGNFIHDNGDIIFWQNGSITDPDNWNKDHGVYAEPFGAVIRNNVFSTHEHGFGLKLRGVTPADEPMTGRGAENVEVYNNTFAHPNPVFRGHLILTDSVYNISIKNNIFFDPKAYAVQHYKLTGSDVFIENNVTTAPSMDDTRSNQPPLPSWVTLGFERDASDVANFVAGDNLVSAVPGALFTSATPTVPADFQLQSSSPAVDLGVDPGNDPSTVTHSYPRIMTVTSAR